MPQHRRSTSALPRGSRLLEYAICAAVMATMPFAVTAARSQPVAALSCDRQAAAQEAIAAALFAAGVTLKVFQQSANAQLGEPSRRIDGLESRLNAEGGRNAALQRELTQDKERFVADLAALDRTCAREIAYFRGTVQDLASTPEGEAALHQYNAGNRSGARLAFERLNDAEERVLEASADVQKAVGRRRLAVLALDSLSKGDADASTAEVIKLYEAVTRVDPGLHWDWVDLSRLYTDAGNLQGARQSAARPAQTAGDDRDRSVALDELVKVMEAQGDLAGAHTRHQDGLDIDKRLAAAAQSSASQQLDVWVSMWKRADMLPSDSAPWRVIVEHMANMQERRMLLPADGRILDEARRRAHARKPP